MKQEASLSSRHAGAHRTDRAPSSIIMTGDDLHLFNEGTHYRLYDKLGAHLTKEGGRDGCRFTVWAPSARSVSVIGAFNDWSVDAAPMGGVGAGHDGLSPRLRRSVRPGRGVHGGGRRQLSGGPGRAGDDGLRPRLG